MGNLGKLIYQGDFKTRVVHKNDENCHLNNSIFSVYSEKIRQKFLKQFGWSDNWFRSEKNIAMCVRERKVKYKKPIRTYDELKIELKIFLDKKPFFWMNYSFYNSNGELVFIDEVKTLFLDIFEKEEKHRDIPEFFLESLC